MGRIHIRRITLQAFRSFRDRQSTKLLPVSGLVGIRGKDTDSGVSSGTGKSTIGLAIAYAFGFCPFPANKQQNWHTKTPMQVEIELDTPQGPAILRRGKEFSLTVAGQEVKGSAKAVEEALAKLTGLPPELLQALTYRQQKKPGRFLSMKDSEKKEFLGVLLGTTELETQISESIKTSNLLQKEADSLNQVVQALEVRIIEPKAPILESVDEYRKIVEGLKAGLVVLVQNRDAVLIKSAELDSSTQYLPRAFVPFSAPDQVLLALKSEFDEVNRRVTAASTKFHEERKELYERAVAINPLIEPLRQQLHTGPGILKQIQAIESENIKLSEAKCAMCLRDWEDAEVRLHRNEDTVLRLSEELSKLKLVKKEIEVLEAKRDGLLEQWNTYSSPILLKLVDIRSEIERKMFVEKTKSENAKALFEAEEQRDRLKFQQKRRSLLDPVEREIESIKQQIRTVEDGIKNAESQIILVERTNQRLVEEYNLALARYQADIKQVTEKKAERDEKQSKANEEADYAHTLKTYLGSLFDEVLQQVSSETNELLKTIPNTPTTTVTFLSETLTEKGVAKQEIKPLVVKNGAEVDLQSGISGGQLESVELAVDLSLVKVIGQRTGVRPGFMIFDESFSAHCVPVKEACMQVLARAAQDCMILIVDHASELKEHFAQFIDIESHRDVSSFLE